MGMSSVGAQRGGWTVDGIVSPLAALSGLERTFALY